MMEAFTAIAQMLGGGAALLTGLRMDRTRKLERLLDKIAGDRDNIPLDELFAAAGIDAAKGRTVVESAISHGYFGADAYIDNRTNTLVVRGAAPQPPGNRSLRPPQNLTSGPIYRNSAAAAAGQRCHPGPRDDHQDQPSGSGQCLHLELAKQDPGKRLSCRNHGLLSAIPALKLLNTYASLPAQDVQGENIADVKKNIERSGLLVTALKTGWTSCSSPTHWTFRQMWPHWKGC